MKLPYFARDFTRYCNFKILNFRWANNGEIPYYFTSTLHQESLSKGYSVEKTGLEDRSVPNDDLDWIILQLKSFYKSKFQIKFPPLNVDSFQERIGKLLNLNGNFLVIQDIRNANGNCFQYF